MANEAVEVARNEHRDAIHRAIAAGEAGDAKACLAALEEAEVKADAQLWVEVAAGLQRWVDESEA
jgi:hypothetical protein